MLIVYHIAFTDSIIDITIIRRGGRGYSEPGATSEPSLYLDYCITECKRHIIINVRLKRRNL